MSTLKDTLRADLTTAMKARDTTRSATLRMALTAVTTAEVAGDTAVELTDDDVLKVLAKEAKKRKEAATAYRDAGRRELADQEVAELAVLEGYLPAQLTDAELEGLVRSAVIDTGASGMAEMGRVMKAVQPLVAGRADGARISGVVRRLLAG
ncbi:MAG: GatB/YqeY domain-containing protein [Actinomycetota bacterium]|nr:GatB/YqeY domain-containing protein [Actinomycetota bacterium]